MQRNLIPSKLLPILLRGGWTPLLSLPLAAALRIAAAERMASEDYLKYVGMEGENEVEEAAWKCQSC